MKPIKIAQIGSSHDHAPAPFNFFLAHPELFEFVGFAESNPERVVPESYNRVPRYTVEQLLAMPDLEAVAVECEEESATAVALPFAERGVAIYMDKPGSQNIPLFERLIEVVKEKKLPFVTGYMYRYNPSILHLKELIRRGELGEIISVEAHMDCLHTPEKRQWLGKYKGGMMYFLGCHLIDMILQLQGEPEEILPMNMATGLDGVTAEDMGFCVLKYKNGISFAKTCASEVNGFLRRQLVVVGSKGTYEIRPWEAFTEGGQISPTRWSPRSDEASNWGKDIAQQLDFGAYDRYAAMMTSFAEIVRGKENPFTYDYELMVFKTVMKCCGYSEE